MSEGGRRARKSAALRLHIADTAARLFGEHGFENVAIVDVARAADVAEQTVYNHFPTKQALALDRADELTEMFTRVVRDRPAGCSPASALREAAYGELDRQRKAPLDRARGDLPALAARSPAFRRLALEALDSFSSAVAEVIVATTPGIDPMIAKAHAAALISVFQQIIEHAGRRYVEGVSGAQVAAELENSVSAAFDYLERVTPTVASQRTRQATS